MPQLDALRALAIFLVMLQHWVPASCEYGPWGQMGVRCFFVLSGFLITGILLRARGIAEAGTTSIGFQFRQFYIRRSLRIFPVFYLTLLVAWALRMQVLRDSALWHAGYLSNVWIALHNEWPGYLSHLWSLSVEEQFYLVWPALILLVPQRALLPVLVGGIALAPITRAALAMTFGAQHLSVEVLTPCCLDALVAGSLLAWLVQLRGSVKALLGRPLHLLGLLGAMGMIGFQIGHGLGWSGVASETLRPLAEAMFFVWVIAHAAVGVRGWIGRLLESRFLQFTGRISYGLYLYHLFCAYMLGIVCHKLNLPAPTDPWITLPIYLVMSYTVAWLSWLVVERPINDLKRHFPHSPRQDSRPAVNLPAIPSSAS